MSFEYFSKDKMQYVLTKIKVLFDKKADVEDIPSKTSDLENDSNFVNEDEISEIINKYVGGSGGYTPIGTIIPFMGNNCPKGYLKCDGAIYNIADYRELAEFIKKEFNSYNKFGGDGETTFAVPDLRGEFLRGTGTNSHTNQGSGAAVGTHQDGTEHMWLASYADGSFQTHHTNSTTATGVNKLDSSINPKSDYYRNHTQSNAGSGEASQNKPTNYTSRPTNTSVLYIIKYTNQEESSDIYCGYEDYSEEEICIGSWIDGKPIYQQTFVGTTPTPATDLFSANASIGQISSSIDTLIGIESSFGYNETNHTWHANSWISIDNSKGGINGVVECRVADKDVIVYNNRTVYGGKKIIATVKFTKTTDTENSFTTDMLSSKFDSSNLATEEEIQEVLANDSE